MPSSSPAFEPAFTLELEPSRWLGVWTTLVCALAVAIAALLGGAVATVLACAGVLAWHAARRRRRLPRLLLHHRDGTWSVPERGVGSLRATADTSWSTWYADLVLADHAGRRERVLILRDQLGAEDWRRVQVALREDRGYAS